METDVGLGVVEDALRITPDVAFLQTCAVGNVVRPSVREIVEHMPLVTACEQRIDHVRADEARASGHDRPHGRIVRPRCSSASKGWTDRAKRPSRNCSPSRYVATDE